MRRQLAKKRVIEIAAGYSAIHDVETVPLAQEVMRFRDHKVVGEVVDERSRQDEIWGGPEHDDEHLTGDFIEFIRERLNIADASNRPSDQRRKLVQVAALAVAAVEALDRRSKRRG